MRTYKDPQPWDVTMEYQIGDKVLFNGVECVITYPKNNEYILEELLAQTTPEDVEYSRKVCHEWGMSKPVGHECYWEDDEGGIDNAMDRRW